MSLTGSQGLKNTLASIANTIANLVGQDIVARSISLTQAAASVAVQLVQGARLKFSATANSDYITSDGTTITIGGPVAIGTSLNTTGGTLSTAGISVSGGSNIVLGASSGIYSTGVVGQRTAPTISSGFGAGAAIATNNGTFCFTINVGTGGVATTGVIGLPAATTGWAVHVMNLSTNTATVFLTKQTATTTTTATIGNYDAAGAAAAWVASDILLCIAVAY